MKKIQIDLRDVMSRSGIHETFKDILHFPPYYGMNLDALHDCLTDIGEDTVLIVREPEEKAGHLSAEPGEGDAADAGYFARLNRVLRDAERTNPHLCTVIFSGELMNGDVDRPPR